LCFLSKSTASKLRASYFESLFEFFLEFLESLLTSPIVSSIFFESRL
jgi:hypothetical protein